MILTIIILFGIGILIEVVARIHPTWNNYLFYHHGFRGLLVSFYRCCVFTGLAMFYYFFVEANTLVFFSGKFEWFVLAVALTLWYLAPFEGYLLWVPYLFLKEEKYHEYNIAGESLNVVYHFYFYLGLITSIFVVGVTGFYLGWIVGLWKGPLFYFGWIIGLWEGAIDGFDVVGLVLGLIWILAVRNTILGQIKGFEEEIIK